MAVRTRYSTRAQPDAGEFHPPTPATSRDDFFQPGTNILRPEKSVDLKRDYGNRGLQVIVKLANIEPSPDKPVYEGGTCKTSQSSEFVFSFIDLQQGMSKDS